MKRHTIFVFANLKPSQIHYKIIPLSKSKSVSKVIILRKDFIKVDKENVICFSLPGILKFRPFYWFSVPLYGLYLIKRFKVTMILNYNILPHGFNAYFASILTRLPVIFSEINEDTIKYYNKIILHPLIKSVLSNASYITIPGSSTELYWRNVGFDKLTRLHSTINTNYFKPDKSLGYKYDFIFIGEYDDNKRPDMILEAFTVLKRYQTESTICLIGFGEMLGKMEDLINKNKLKDSVTLVRSNDVLQYLQQSKIFVMASRSEGIPCALLESMACGLIPIVTKVGDIGDVVKHGVNGFIHDGTIESLYKLMLDTLANFNSYNEISIKARETIINEHSYNVATLKWDKLLNLIE